ncbi:MAG: Mth938-like domain-containing protein [Gammaproteobacteria bacterium]
MKFSTDKVQGNFIHSYAKGVIQLRDRNLTNHTIISADHIISDWQPATIESMTVDDFRPALELKPEILLFGSGEKQQFPDIGLLTEIMRAGTAIEVMETHAACSTFNVLISENRSVVAALLVD